jgi:UDP-N-acetyl-D-glucosamine dehydrogenase
MRVGVIGLGYVGLPLAVAFAQQEVDVVCVERDERKREAILAGESYIEGLDDAALAAAAARIEVTGDVTPLASVDAVLICAPTPLSPNREPDLEPLLDCVRELAGVLRAGQLVVIESTTYPGTTREQVGPLLEQRSGLRAGGDFHLAFSPERIDPGRVDYTLRTTPKIVGGLTPACAERAEALYRLICDEVIRVSTPEAAELTKLLENIFRAVNIALVNELAILTDRMGIDIWEVVDAAATKPYGFMRFEPGPGMGGHCLPVDPFYLAWRAREFDMSTEFIELAGKVNQQMPYHCVAKLQRVLNERGRAVRDARIAVLGVSYKPGVSDIRESPAIKIIELLRGLGAEVVYHDPHVPSLERFDLHSLPLADALAGSALALIVTAHPGIDYDALAAGAECVLDLRGVTSANGAANVVRL